MVRILIIVGILLFVLFAIFLWLFIAGADESRRRDKNKRDKCEDLNHTENKE